MKLNLQHHNLRSTHELDSLLEERIFKLEPRLQIDEACARLECRWEKSPDLQAEGRDHTVRAALGKAFLDLEDRIREREHNSIWRLRSNMQRPAALRAGRRLR